MKKEPPHSEVPERSIGSALGLRPTGPRISPIRLHTTTSNTKQHRTKNTLPLEGTHTQTDKHRQTHTHTDSEWLSISSQNIRNCECQTVIIISLVLLFNLIILVVDVYLMCSALSVSGLYWPTYFIACPSSSARLFRVDTVMSLDRKSTRLNSSHL